VVVCLVDIGGIIDCLNFLFIITQGIILRLQQ